MCVWVFSVLGGLLLFLGRGAAGREEGSLGVTAAEENSTSDIECRSGCAFHDGGVV
jgi:hypothetical protein